MFYTSPTLRTRVRRQFARHPLLSAVLKLAVGMHVAHGLAHGVQPDPTSEATQKPPAT